MKKFISWIKRHAIIYLASTKKISRLFRTSHTPDLKYSRMFANQYGTHISGRVSWGTELELYIQYIHLIDRYLVFWDGNLVKIDRCVLVHKNSSNPATLANEIRDIYLKAIRDKPSSEYITVTSNGYEELDDKTKTYNRQH